VRPFNGEVIRSWSVYYQYQHFIPEDRLQQLFSDLYGIQLVTATLTKYNRIAFDALAPFEESILSQVKIAAVKNLDETGFRVAGKTQWLHEASTKTATFYHVSPRRKSLLKAFQALWFMTIGKVISICSELNTGFVINITCAN